MAHFPKPQDAVGVASETAAPRWTALALMPGLLVVLCLVLYPLGLAAWTSLRLGAGGPSLDEYAALLAGTAGLGVLLRTIALALATMLGSIVLSIPLGYLARDTGWLGTAIRTLIMLPLAVPVLIAAYALTLFFSDNGLLNNVLVHVLHVTARPVHIAYTWGGLVVACIWRFSPYTSLMVVTALAAIDRNVEEAAASTGANPVQAFRRVTLPLIMPATITGGILTFVSTFGTFSIPLIMGRNADVLSVLAYRQISGSFDWPAASTTVIVMSVVQIAILVGLRSGVARWTRRA